MRDIRNDLKERLESLSQERDGLEKQYQGRLREFEGRESLLRQLLHQEDVRALGDQPSLFRKVREGQADKETSDLTRLILDMLADGQNWSLDRLKEAGEKRGVLGGFESPGRSIHGALLSLKRQAKVQNIDQGVWRQSKMKDAPTAEPAEAS